jgi:hypothetical protein
MHLEMLERTSEPIRVATPRRSTEPVRDPAAVAEYKADLAVYKAIAAFKAETAAYVLGRYLVEQPEAGRALVRKKLAGVNDATLTVRLLVFVYNRHVAA